MNQDSAAYALVKWREASQSSPINMTQATICNPRHIVLLIQRSECFEDGNYLRFANQLLLEGQRVSLCLFSSIKMHASKIVASGFEVNTQLQPGNTFPIANLTQQNLAKADLVWVLSLGMRDSFLDSLQLLRCLEDQTKVINSSNAILHLKSKYYLAGHSDIFKYPETYGASDPEYLFDIISSKGGDWIVKPPAGSMGRDVYKLNAQDPNCRVILASMTGVEENKFCLIQPFIEEISQGEKRVLFSGGQVVGQYLRLPTLDHRTNVSTGASFQACDLTEAEKRYCLGIGKFLLDEGAYFVALDLAYPYVVEFNVINPGGVLTIDSIGGSDMSSEIIKNIFEDLF